MATTRKVTKEVPQYKKLESIVKNLGYNSVQDMPSRESLIPKLADSTLTVREAVVLDLYVRGVRLQPATLQTEIGKGFNEKFGVTASILPEKDAPAPSAAYTRINGVSSSAVKAGFQLNTPIIEIINSREALEKINEVSSTAIDPKWSGVFRSIEAANGAFLPDTPLAYKSPKIVGRGLSSAQQSRRSKKFTAVPPPEEVFPEISAGLQQIEYPSDRNALVAFGLSPYRPGEMVNLRLGKYDPQTITADRAPGYFDPEKGEIVFPEGSQTKTKGALERLKLDPNSVLYNVLIEQSRIAELEGSDYLFPDVTTQTTTDAIKTHITPRLSQFEDILGRSFDESKDFRKLIASMVIYELGYQAEAKDMLGHANDAQINATIGKVMDNFYASRIASSDSPLTSIYVAYENLIGNSLGVNSVNDIAIRFGLDLPGFTDIDETSNNYVPLTKKGQVVESNVPRPPTAEEVQDSQETRERTQAENYRATQFAIQEGQEVELKNLEQAEQIESKRQEQREQKARSKVEAKEKAEEERKAALKMDDDQSDKFLKIFGDITGNKYTQAFLGALPAAGLGLASVSLSQDIQADIEKGEGVFGTSPEVSAAIRTAKVAAEEFTPQGILIGLAESQAKSATERGKQLLEQSFDMDEEELLRSFGRFGAEMRGY